MVDDGSTDGTAAEVGRWVAQLGTDAVRLLTLSENQGKGAAVGKVPLSCVAADKVAVLREMCLMIRSICCLRRVI